MNGKPDDPIIESFPKLIKLNPTIYFYCPFNYYLHRFFPPYNLLVLLFAFSLGHKALKHLTRIVS